MSNHIQQNRVNVIPSHGLYTIIVNTLIICGDYNITLRVNDNVGYDSTGNADVDVTTHSSIMYDVRIAQPITACLSRGDLVWLAVNNDDAATLQSCSDGHNPLIRMTIWAL